MHATNSCVVQTEQAKTFERMQQKANAHLSNLLTRDKLPIAAPDSRCRAAQLRDLVNAAMRAVSRALLCSSSICWATHRSSTTCGRSWLAGWLIDGSAVLPAITKVMFSLHMCCRAPFAGRWAALSSHTIRESQYSLEVLCML